MKRNWSRLLGLSLMMATLSSVGAARAGADEAAPEKLLILPVAWQNHEEALHETETKHRLLNDLFDDLRAGFKGVVVADDERDRAIEHEGVKTCLEKHSCKEKLAQALGATLVLAPRDAKLDGPRLDTPKKEGGVELWSLELGLTLYSMGAGGSHEAATKIVQPGDRVEDLKKQVQLSFAELYGQVASGRRMGSSEGPSRRKLFVAGSVAAIVVGVAAAGTGVVLLAIDGGQACDLMSPAKQCPELWDTRTPGALLLVGGGVVAGAGVVGLILGLKMPERPVAVIPILSPGVAGLSVSGRF